MRQFKSVIRQWPVYVLLMCLVGMFAYQTYAMRSMREMVQVPQAIAGTVDIPRLFNQMNFKAEADAELQALANKLDAEAKRKRDQIEQLQADLELLESDGAAAKAAEVELLQATFEFELQVQYAQNKLENEKAKSLKRIYKHIREAAAAVADKHGVNVVMVDDSVGDIRGSTEAEVNREISARRLLYADQSVDITDLVLEELNR